MELICASIMRYLDRCPQVIAYCKTINGQPHAPALAGDPPDIAGLFPRTQNARGFVIHAEVSAKRNMNLKAFHKQLTWGYNHCMARAKKHPGLLIFCLLINNAESHVNNQYHAAYRAFLNEKSLTANSHIRMLPWCAKDFAALTGKMYFDFTKERLYFDSDVLLKALVAVHEQKIQQSLPDDRMWMNTLYRDTIDLWLSGKEQLPTDEGKGPGER